MASGAGSFAPWQWRSSHILRQCIPLIWRVKGWGGGGFFGVVYIVWSMWGGGGRQKKMRGSPENEASTSVCTSEVILVPQCARARMCAR